MVGKFFLITLLCVSLAQVQGNELENAIRNGLNKVKNLYEQGQRRIDAAFKEVDYKTNIIESKTADYVKKSNVMQDEIKKALRNVAQAMEEKAKEMNKPQSVFECIKRNEEKANNQIKTLSEKLKTDVERLEKVKLANIQTDSKPLYEMPNTLKVRYERAVKIIENCRNPSCVNTATRSCAQWLEHLYSDIRRILGQVATVSGNFFRDANNYYNNANRQINMIKSSSMRNIRNCVFKRDAQFGEY